MKVGKFMKYTYGISRTPLLELDGEGNEIMNIFDGSEMIGRVNNSELSYLVKDHLGSTRLIVSGKGEKIGEFDYSDLGETLEKSEPGRSLDSVKYRYTGQEWDEELGQYNYLAREYDPGVGRFDSVDPAREGFSPYTYVGNNPINYLDPDGEARKIYLFTQDSFYYEDNIGRVLERQHPGQVFKLKDLYANPGSLDQFGSEFDLILIGHGNGIGSINIDGRKKETSYAALTRLIPKNIRDKTVGLYSLHCGSAYGDNNFVKSFEKRYQSEDWVKLESVSGNETWNRWSNGLGKISISPRQAGDRSKLRNPYPDNGLADPTNYDVSYYTNNGEIKYEGIYDPSKYNTKVKYGKTRKTKKKTWPGKYR